MSSTEPEFLQQKNGWQPQGCVIVEKDAVTGAWKGNIIQIQLNFYSEKELVELVAWAVAHGYRPSGNSVKCISSNELFGMPQEEVPVCPVHKTKMSHSQKFRGYYCTERDGDKWCKCSARPDASGRLIIKRQ